MAWHHGTKRMDAKTSLSDSGFGVLGSMNQYEIPVITINATSLATWREPEYE